VLNTTLRGDASEPRAADKLSTTLGMNRKQRTRWRASVLGCVDLTAAHKVVLLALETFADYPAGTNARPGTERLAEMCNLKTRAVEGALQRGRDLGLIERTARANPKRHLAAVYRLVSTRTSVRVETDFNPHETDFNPHVNAFLPARACTPPIHTNPVTPRESAGDAGPDEPLDVEAVPDQADTLSLLDADPDPEPEQFCAAHRPYGTGEKCPDCKTFRINHERWTERQSRAFAERAAPRTTHDPAKCDNCDNHGWRLDHGGRDGDRPMKCNGQRKAS